MNNKLPIIGAIRGKRSNGLKLLPLKRVTFIIFKKLLKKMIKQRDESIEIYKKNNRQDLLVVEQKEHEIISAFLPKQLSEEETKNICNEIIKKLNASSIKDMGEVMGVLKKDYSDNLDFSKAGSYLKETLNIK